MPEHYDATVSDTTIFPKPDVLFVKLNYEIINFKGGPFTVAELTPLHADRNSPKYAETVKGKARVKAILEINDKDVTTIGIEDVPLLLRGCKVRIAIGYQDIGGLASPSVLGIVGPAARDSYNSGQRIIADSGFGPVRRLRKFRLVLRARVLRIRSLKLAPACTGAGDPVRRGLVTISGP